MYTNVFINVISFPQNLKTTSGLSILLHGVILLPDATSYDNIGITHAFSCVNICRVPRKLFEHEAVRPSVQTTSEGPSKC